jgi:hypothetical protein
VLLWRCGEGDLEDDAGVVGWSGQSAGQAGLFIEAMSCRHDLAQGDGVLGGERADAAVPDVRHDRLMPLCRVIGVAEPDVDLLTLT